MLTNKINKKILLKYSVFTHVALSLTFSAHAKNTCFDTSSLQQICVLSTDSFASNGSVHSYASAWRSETGMQDLGTLKSDNSGSSYPLAVSADGRTVVGQADNDAWDQRAFSWRTETGMLDLGTLKSDNSGSSSANAVSADGLTVVGYADNDAGQSRAFAWRTETGMLDLGTFKSDNSGYSFAYAVSADGSTVVGQADNDAWDQHAFAWRTETGMLDLGTLKSDNSGYSSATAVSANGLTVVGYAYTDFDDQHAFVWRAETGMLDLGTLRSDNSGISAASAVSANGSTVVGRANNDSGEQHAFVWRTGTGMLDLGTLRSDNSGYSGAYAVSADGSTVVGDAADDSGSLQAFIWRTTKDNEDSNGNTNGGGNGSTNGGGNGNTNGSGNGSTDGGSNGNTDGSGNASTDGGGNGSTNSVGNIGVMQNLNNLRSSYNHLSDQTELAIRSQQRAMGDLLDQSCFADKTGQSCIRISGIITSTPSSREEGYSGMGRTRMMFGALSYGYGITDQITLGGAVSIYGASRKENAVNMRNGMGLGIFSRYSQGGNAHTGWQAGINIGYGLQSMEIVRGLGLSNVQYGHGNKNLSTLALRVNVGYGFTIANNWLLSPSANISYYHSSRGGYREEGMGLVFNTEYNHLRNNSTVASVGLMAEKQIGERSRVQFGLGVDIDLKVESVKLSGQNDVFTLGNSVKPFSVSTSLARNKTRPYGQLSYSYALSGNKGTIGTGLRVSLPEYGTKSVDYGLGLNYTINF